MRALAILILAVGACRAAISYGPTGGKCGHPNWTCDCKLIYRCDAETDFPENYEDAEPVEAGVLKDLAPKYHPIEIPGKRWRRNSHNQEEYCQRKCNDRMNAFLSLDETDSLTDYSDSALCLKFFGLDAGPFASDGSAEPCCLVYLEYGRQWCTPKWNEEITTIRCLARDVDASFSGVASSASVHNVFSAEPECDPTTMSFTWCDAAPMCPTPPE